MFPFPLAAHDGFKRLSVPFACLRYGNPWNLILLFSLQGVLFINIAQAFILHKSICFDYSSRIACYKSSRCSLPFFVTQQFQSCGLRLRCAVRLLLHPSASPRFFFDAQSSSVLKRIRSFILFRVFPIGII